MSATQETFPFTEADRWHSLPPTSGWAPSFFPDDFHPDFAGELVLYPGHGLTAVYRMLDRPAGALSTPHGSPAAMQWATCGPMAIAALMGASLDYIRHAWRGDASRGTTLKEMRDFAKGHCGFTQAFSTERHDLNDCIIWADQLVWPICGMVGVTLADGEAHWVSTLNGNVYDALQGEAMSLLDWDALNRPYAMDDMIIIGPGILRREWRWTQEPNIDYEE